jgi:hypothetical protein
MDRYVCMSCCSVPTFHGSSVGEPSALAAKRLSHVRISLFSLYKRSRVYEAGNVAVDGFNSPVGALRQIGG